MDFFQQQDQARKKTGTLLACMGLAVMAIIAVIYLILRIGIGQTVSTSSSPYGSPQPFIDLNLLFPTAFGVLTLILLGSIYKTMQLRGGGEKVAESLGGRRISSDTRDPDERKVLNIIEEMAVASGIPPPPVYLLPEPASINAFAAGWDPDSAVVGITEGAIRALSRDELQGVIAHEFSHIFNGDMRINIRLIGILHGILLLAIIGELLLRSGRYSRNRKNNGGQIALGLALFIVGQVGVFFGHFIKSAISRQREFLADASAVQFTRNPLGLSGALKKIGGITAGSRIEHPQAETASHLFFSNGMKTIAFQGLATHPPLEKRVRRMEPQFDGKWPQLDRTVLFKLTPPVENTDTNIKAGHPPSSPFPDILKDTPVPDSAKPVLTGMIVAGASLPLNTIGQAGPQHLAAAKKLLDTIPESLREAARSPASAELLIYALLLRRSGDSRNELFSALENALSSEAPDALPTVTALEESCCDLPPGIFLPLAETAVNGLRDLSPKAFQTFQGRFQMLIEHDRTIDLFEFALEKIILRPLLQRFNPSPRIPIRIYAPAGVPREVEILLSAMAWAGHSDPEAAAEAFSSSLHTLEGRALSSCRLQPRDAAGLRDIRNSLDRFQEVSFAARKQILQACLICLMSDESIRLEEAELFRAIAAAFSCPAPLWLLPESEQETKE